jgi:hypothetical protein
MIHIPVLSVEDVRVFVALFGLMDAVSRVDFGHLTLRPLRKSNDNQALQTSLLFS